MFKTLKTKTPKATHCWSCTAQLNVLFRRRIQCGGDGCKHTICRQCAATLRIANKKIRVCYVCCEKMSAYLTTATKIIADGDAKREHRSNLDATNGQAKETCLPKIETAVSPQILSMEEQITQQLELIKRMEALMTKSTRCQSPAAEPPALSVVVPKAQCIQPVQGRTHPFLRQDSQDCSNFKQNPIEMVDSFKVSASQPRSKTKTRKLSTSAATANVSCTNVNYKIATSASQWPNISGNHGVTRLHSKGSSINVSLSIHDVNGASHPSRSQRQSGRRQRSQQCRPHDV